MRLLLIDDHAMFRQGLTFLLTDLEPELRFSEAGSCHQAMEVLSRDEVDLILLDLMMPEMDGFDFLNKAHEMELLSETPVIVLTAMDLDQDQLKALNQQVSKVLPKAMSSNKDIIEEVRRVFS